MSTQHHRIAVTKSKRNDTKRSGEQKDDEIDRKTSESRARSAIELYMACTTNSRFALEHRYDR